MGGRNCDRIFKPHRDAVIGASRKSGPVDHTLLHSLMSAVLQITPNRVLWKRVAYGRFVRAPRSSCVETEVWITHGLLLVVFVGNYLPHR